MNPITSRPRLSRPGGHGVASRFGLYRLCLGLAVAHACPSHAEEAATPVPGTITTAGEFWNLSIEEKRKVHPVDLEMTVFYYDAAWKVMWGESGGQGFFLPVRPPALPIESGQKVRLRGNVLPLEGLGGDTLEATVLSGSALPPPIDTRGRLDDYRSLDTRWVEVDGYVLSQSEADPGHIQYVVFAGKHTVLLRLKLSGTDPVPQLAGARVRARGVLVVSGTEVGHVAELGLWAARANQIEIVGWMQDDERFKLPRTPMDQLASAAGHWVRIEGAVHAQEPGKSISVRDETALILIPTAQPQVLGEGEALEVVGMPVPGETGWTLEQPLFRRRADAGTTSLALRAPGQAPRRLRLAEQVLQLPATEAEKRFPVTLRGVVTWANEHADFFYLQDASGGVRIRLEPGRGTAPEVGSSLIVNGVTARGSFVSEVELLDATFLGTLPQPPVRGITLEQALSGAHEGQRVEMRGFVHNVGKEGNWTRLDVTTTTGEMVAFLPAGMPLDYLQGALVRLRGICTVLANASREPTDIRLWLQNHEAIVVDDPAPTELFSTPAQPIASLREFGANLALNRRVRVRGTLLLQEPGRYLYVQDETGGLFVLTRKANAFHPGDGIDLVGFAGRAGNRTVVREPVMRAAPDVAPVAPQSIAASSPLVPAADGRLVAVEATVRQSVVDHGLARIVLQSDAAMFDAALSVQPNWSAPPVGSRVRTTGVYVLEYDEYRKPHDFHLELRSPADVVLLESPAWWTVRRIWYAAGLLALLVLGAMAWVTALRHKVRVQTELIRRQMEKEARLQGELERSSRLESLGVLAGGIAHDFNNLLTAVLGNLGLAAMDKRVMAAAGDCISEAERAARRARDVTLQLLTFAKGGDPVRSAVLLPDIVSEAANFARHGSNVRLEINHPPDLPPGDVDAGQISRVVHNLVINAVQAMPGGGVVRVGLTPVQVEAGEVDALAPGAYIVLTVADTGRGIPAENLARIFDPYFSTKAKGGNSGLGLATVRSIVKKHGGHIEVESQVGQGTTFRIWLPAASRPASRSPSAPRANSSGPARILVMDDEEVIRRVAGRMLSLAGHEPVFAADGEEAVRVYAAALKSSRPFDLVIFDLTVPGGMGGREALAELLRIDPQVRAIASSGYSSDPVMASPRQFGFITSLPKPYDIPDLLHALDDVRRA